MRGVWEPLGGEQAWVAGSSLVHPHRGPLGQRLAMLVTIGILGEKQQLQDTLQGGTKGTPFLPLTQRLCDTRAPCALWWVELTSRADWVPAHL